MTNLGRNFELLQNPDQKHRLGRFRLKDGLTVPIGTPLRAVPDTGLDVKGRRTLETAPAASAPATGATGIGIYIYTYNWDRGKYPTTLDPSDLDMVPEAQPVQLVHGDEVRVRFRNTVERLFQGQRQYSARTMVAGLGATPTLEIDDLLTPGAGDDVNGWWAKTTDAALAWFRVTSVSATEVEAQLLY